MKTLRIACLLLSLASLAACLWFGWEVYAANVRSGPQFDRYCAKLGTASLVWFLTAPFWMTPELFGRNKEP